ncbi:MAG: DUF456 domain-containing protein [Candidatus Aureabacteria bacterium]|nr:DUF456 domain-containing protein [Candidatus Auribacterota bacterium]
MAVFFIVLAKIFIAFLCIAGIFLSLMSFGGGFLITLAYLLLGLANRFENFSMIFFLILLALSIFAEVLEFFSTAIGTKKFGGSNLSFFTTLVFGIIGGIWGTFILPLLGTLIGTLIGAAAAAFITELILKKQAKPALKTTFGVLAGKTISIAIKTFISLIMAISVIISMF